MINLKYINSPFGIDDFQDVKNDGFDGVILPFSDKSPKDTEMAAQAGLSVWILLSMTDETEYEYIESSENGIVRGSSVMRFVGTGAIDKLKTGMTSKQFDNISGVIFTAPFMNKLIWRDEFKDEYENIYSDSIEEALLDIFDPQLEVCPARAWYYLKAERTILSEFINPTVKYIKDLGKEAVVCAETADLGKGVIGKVIDHSIYYESGIPLALQCGKRDLTQCAGILSAFSGIGGNLLILNDNVNTDIGKFDLNMAAAKTCCEVKERRGSGILVVLPVRGVAEQNHSPRGSKLIVENPALSTETEGRYFCDKLYLKGIEFDAANELALERAGSTDKNGFHIFGKCYNTLLVCSGCSFNEKGIEILHTASGNGISINDADLIGMLDLEGEEEWER